MASGCPEGNDLFWGDSLVEALHNALKIGKEFEVIRVWNGQTASRQEEIILFELDCLRKANTELFLEATNLLKIAVSYTAPIRLKRLIVNEICKIRDDSEFMEIRKCALDILWESQTHSYQRELDEVLKIRQIRISSKDEWELLNARAKSAIREAHKLDLDFVTKTNSNLVDISIYSKRIDVRKFSTLFNLHNNT